MDDPKIATQCHGIDGVKSVTLMGESDFINTALKTLHRLGDVGFLTFAGDLQRKLHLLLHRLREALKILVRSFHP